MNKKQRICLDILILFVLLLIMGRLPSNIAYIHTLKLRDEVKIINENKTEEEEPIGTKYNIGYKDIIAKLNIPGTGRTDYITQTTDNDYYLSHDLEKKYDTNGNPFLDSRNDLYNDKVLIIYGHNSRRKEMPFNYLQNYYKEDFFYEHQFIRLYIDGENRRYKIFSIYTETSDWSYRNIDFNSDEEYLNHINDLKEKSIFKTGDNDLTSKDEILILQTCSTHDDYLKYKDKFLLVIAKRWDND